LGFFTPFGGLALALGWVAMARDYYACFFVPSDVSEISFLPSKNKRPYWICYGNDCLF